VCGFLGVLRGAARGPVTVEDLAPHAPWLAHRGPDGAGLAVGGGVGLLASRLSIQGDRAARQPLRSASGRVALAWNGEILGRDLRRLRQAVERAGGAAPGPREGDSALLLAAFTQAVEHGAGFADPLAEEALSILAVSMGALAVLDLAAGRVLLARDRLGIKPLHLLELGPQELWFASELEPLLRVRGGAELDLGGLAQLVRWQRPGERLPWTNLRTLPPRSALEIAPDLARRSRWIAPDLLDTPRLEVGQSEGACRALAAALATSARAAAQVDGPVALFLSGGLDSAAVAAAAGRADVLALTGRFAPRGGPLDESAGAAAVAQQVGIPHEVLDLSDEDLLADLPAVVRALELPLAGPGSLALWRLFARAREHGRVVLTGTGGDELLGGYVRSALALGRAGAWSVGYEALAQRLALLPEAGARVRAAHDRSADLAPLLHADFAAALLRAQPAGSAELGGVETLTRPGSSGSRPSEQEEGSAALRAVLAPELEGTLPALLHVEDRLAAAHGLESRPVFCLGALPQAALSLPPEQVVGPDGEGKRALRCLLKGRLPEAVLRERVKRGFPTPFGRAARGAGRARAEALLGDRRFRERGWWNVEASRALLDEERPLHDRALFALLSLETWARLYVDGDAQALPPRGAAAVPALR